MKRTRTAKQDSDNRDFRALLQERFRAAVRRNSRFSLRSFALQLGINHSTLSQILRNKRPLSVRSIESMGRRLGLNETLIDSYKQGLKKRTNASSKTNSAVRNFQFDLDTFHLLSTWWHQAILELTHTRGFKTDSRWIASRLGISVDDVNIALQRLLRLGLLEMATSNRWIDKSGDAEFHTHELAPTAIKRINEEVHELATNVVKRSESDRLAHSQMVVAINSKNLRQLQTAADEFMNVIRSLVEEDSTRDEVYQVAVSLFPLSKSQIRGEENDG